MSNVLILTNSLVGLYSFRKEVVRAISDAGYGVVIATPIDDQQKCDFFRSLGFDVRDIAIDRRGTNPIKDIKLLVSFIRLIKEVKPSVVLTYTIKPNVFGGLACRLTRTRYLANITGLGDSIETPGVLQKISVILYRIGLKGAQCVFFQNRYNQDFCVIHRMVSTKTKLLPGSGVNLNWHNLQPFPSDEVTKFIYVGRLMEHKGSNELFEMISRIKQKYGPKVEFHVCGQCEDGYQGPLDDFIAKGYVIYHGPVSDIRPYFAEVHCNIMPSWHEGMSNVNLEASAAGRAVITSNVPGCLETVNDGISGFLVEVKNVYDLTNSVERFIALSYEEKKQMGLCARQKVEKEFDRQLVIDSYLSEILSV